MSHKFELGDTVYVVDYKKQDSSKAEIRKFIFNAYSDETYKIASIKNDTNVIIANIKSNSIFESVEKATRFAVVFLIKKNEPILHYSIYLDHTDPFEYIENNYPELILKHVGNVKNLNK
jgi:hypothetical protein